MDVTFWSYLCLSYLENIGNRPQTGMLMTPKWLRCVNLGIFSVASKCCVQPKIGSKCWCFEKISWAWAQYLSYLHSYGFCALLSGHPSMRRPGQQLSIIELGKMRRKVQSCHKTMNTVEKDETHLQRKSLLQCNKKESYALPGFQFWYMLAWLWSAIHASSSKDLGHRASLLLESNEARLSECVSDSMESWWILKLQIVVSHRASESRPEKRTLKRDFFLKWTIHHQPIWNGGRWLWNLDQSCRSALINLVDPRKCHGKVFVQLTGRSSVQQVFCSVLG